MTINELIKELGATVGTMNSFSAAGIIDSIVSPPNSKEISEKDSSAIRKCCLFRMLGFDYSELKQMSEADTTTFKGLIGNKITKILEDTDNPTQSAIVLQNIKRYENSFEEMSPDSYLDHLFELRAKGGIFYDVNSGLLAGNDSPWKKIADREKAYRQAHDSFSNHIYDAEAKYKQGKLEEEQAAHQTFNSDDFSKEQTDSNTAEGNSDENTIHDKTGDNSYYRNGSNYSGGFGGFGPFGFGAYANSQKNARRGFGSAYTDSEEKNKDGRKICPHPFFRYFARLLDQTLVSILVDIFIEFVIGISISTSYTLEFIEILASFFLMCLIEPFILSTFGTTPGKKLLGIRITKRDEDRKLSLSEAANRTLKMFRYGMGFMIPIYSLITEVRSFQECKFERVLKWDEDCDIQINNYSFTKLFAFMLSMLIIVNVSDIINYQAMIPSNTGNITKEQFYENCSHTIKYFNFQSSIDLSAFKLTTDSNGYVTSVTYEDTFTGNKDISSDAIYIAFFSFAAATNGSNGIKLSYGDVLNTIIKAYSDYTYNYCDVTITNTLENDGFQLINYMGTTYYEATKDDATLKLTFKLSKN